GRISVAIGAEELAPGPLAQPGGLHASLVVEDTGCGMDEETRARIFDPFFSTRPGGRGLGLATVLGIVSGHQGRLDVITAPGAGTTVRVLLPVRSSAA